MIKREESDDMFIYFLSCFLHTEGITLCSFFPFSVFGVHCHCVNCSVTGECLSRGFCEEGYWGDNCMLYDVLSVNDERLPNIYMTNSSIYRSTYLVRVRLNHISL